MIATIAAVVQALALVGVAVQLWRVGVVLRDLHNEAAASSAERESRKEAERAGALFDAQRVREAEYVLATLDTDPQCYPCREAVERGRVQLRERLRVSSKTVRR